MGRELWGNGGFGTVVKSFHLLIKGEQKRGVTRARHFAAELPEIAALLPRSAGFRAS